MTDKFNIKLTFSDIGKRAANSLFTLSKTQEKHEVHRKLSSTRKKNVLEEKKYSKCHNNFSGDTFI